MKLKLLIITLLLSSIVFIYLNRQTWFPPINNSEKNSTTMNISTQDAIVNKRNNIKLTQLKEDRKTGSLICNKVFYGRIENSLVKLMFSPDESERTGFLTYFKDGCVVTYDYEVENGIINCKTDSSPPCGVSAEPISFVFDDKSFQIIADDSGYKSIFTTTNNETPYETEEEKEVKRQNSQYSINRKGHLVDNALCPLCNGTGIEQNRSSMTSEYGRVCPQCNGTGHEHY